MSDMAMGSAPYPAQTYAFIFWYLIAGCLVVSSVIAWSFEFSTKLRTRALTNGEASPAKSSRLYTAVSVVREASYTQWGIPYIGNLPTTGNMLVSAVYIAILLSCLLSQVWAEIPMFWEAIALRAGYLSVAQLSLLIALSTKRNFIAYMTHTSHERINIYHRLVGICVLVTSTIHMGFYLREWLYYNVWKSQWAEMGVSMLQWGFAAWGILIFILFSSISIIRAKLYSTWIVLHVLSMVAFLAMVIMHLDPPYRVWAYVPIAIWVVDRAIRFMSRIWLNVRASRGLTSACTVEHLTGNVTRVTVPNYRLARKPGQFVYLSIYQLGIHSHPFTMVSLTDASDLVFLLKAKTGMTSTLRRKASLQLPPNHMRLQCSIEGPYGGSHIAMQSFDTVVLIAGGVGATFTKSLLQDIVRKPGCCRIVRYIWIVKSAKHVDWFADIIAECKQEASAHNVSLSFGVWVTCDEEYTSTEQEKSIGCVNCQCKKTIEPSEIEIISTEKSTQSSSSSFSNELQESRPCCCRQVSTVSQEQEYYSGRPDLYRLISGIVEGAQGETGVAVCGPTTLTRDVRNTVFRISDERAVKKGTGAEAIYLHVENQGY